MPDSSANSETVDATADPAADGTTDGRHEAPPTKQPLAANDGKQLGIELDGLDGDVTWARVPIQTDLFARGDDLAAKVTEYVEQTVQLANADERFTAGFAEPWYVVVSEKIVAISQGRSYFTWEINPRLSARVLAKFVHRTPYGIGLGSPWTMQLAINEAGLPRIVLAAGASVVGKVLGRKGWFYQVAGNRVNAIDGPTPYSAYPSNVSAKLPPKDPEVVARKLHTTIHDTLPEALADSFGGVVVIDSNDLGRDVLGQDTDRPDDFFCELFRDNPFGQGRQQTPIAVCVRLSPAEPDAT